MRILLVATGVFLKGGIERYTRYQYEALQQLLGKENVYLASLLGNDGFNAFEDEIEVEYVQGGISLYDKILFLFKCLFLVRKHQIDTVLCNHRQLSVIGYLSKKIFGIRYFTNVYGLEIWSGMNKIETMALLKSDRIIGDCNFILNCIRQRYKFPPSKTDLLFDPVDIHRFFPKAKNEKLYEKYNIPRDKFIIATVGRLERNKGHEMVISTLKALDESIIYLVVGGGRFSERLNGLAINLNLENRVFFTGRVSEDELVDCYNIADIVVLLSTFDKNEGEGLPLGLIEASACGKPVICGNEDGSQDAISRDLPNGMLINPRDQNELLYAINRYFNDPILLTEHGNNGRKFVADNFEFSIFKNKQKNILSELEA